MFELMYTVPLIPFVLLVVLGAITRQPWTLNLFLALVVLQNIIGIGFSNFGDETAVQIVLLLKELLVYLAIFFALISACARSIRPSRVYIFILLFFIVVGAYCFIGESTLMARLACLRAIITPLILFCFGCTIFISRKKLERFLRIVIFVGLLVAVFGFLESYVLSFDFWIEAGLPLFNEIKGFSGWANAEGIPYSFVTYDFYSIMGAGIRRMASIIAEPIAFGHIMAFCFCISLFGKQLFLGNDIIRKVSCVLFFIAACLSFSKGAFLIVCLTAILRFINLSSRLTRLALYTAIIAALIVVAGNMTTSMNNHAMGLFGSFEQHWLLGDGVGAGGNYAGLYGDSNMRPAGAESYIGSMIVQCGFPVACVFTLIFVLVFSNIIVRYKLQKVFNSSKRSESYLIGTLCFVAGCLIESLVSESSLAFIGCGLGFAILGLVFQNSKEELKVNNNGKD